MTAPAKPSAHPNPAPQAATEQPAQRVEQRIRESRDSLPGQRDALPPKALGGIPPTPQGDENRDPPANAPNTPD